jgi:hypothetical protein
METGTMGRVTVGATIENLEDLWAVKRGLIPADQARRVVVSDTLVDPAIALPSLPRHLVRRLGLARTSSGRGGVEAMGGYRAVRLTIRGRSRTTEVREGPEDSVPTIGHLALTNLDFVVDPHGLTLIGNPAHGGEQMYELY